MPEKYKKYEFCKDVECEEFIENKCMTVCAYSCLRTAKQFHKWLKENNFEIVKK